jgi:hypothetical protein
MAKFKTKDTNKMTEKQLAKYKQDEHDWSLYGRSKAMYEGTIRSAIRKLWMISKGRGDALKRSRIPNNTGSKHKWLETCEVCGKAATIGEKEFKPKADGTLGQVKRTVLVVHHIIGVPDVFHQDFLRNMFCEQYDKPSDGYEICCHKCHLKTHAELELNKVLMEKPNG